MIEWSHSLAGALTGLIIGLTGVGGGAIMAPILLLVFDISIGTVVATDLWFAALTKMAVIRIYSTHDHIDWKVARWLWLGSIPTSTLVIIVLTSGSVTKLSGSLLQQGIGFLILLTSIGLLINQILKKKEINFTTSDFLKNVSSKFSKIRSGATIIAGGIVGVIVTLTSVGAGVLGTLVLIYLYSSHMASHKIVATEVVHAIPLALVAGIGYLICGKVDGTLLLSLLIGSVPAAILGASLAQKTNSNWLRIGIAIVMFLAGLKLVL
jgi:uncharacterized protein